MKESYDLQRSAKLEKASDMTLEEYVYLDEPLCISLLDGELLFGVAMQVYERLTSLVSNRLLQQQYRRVVELGSGDGRNLLYLSRKHPSFEFIGLDFSPRSVELANSTASRLNIANVKFYTADLTKVEQYSHHLEKSAVFSMHCLEEMPRAFKHTLRALSDTRVTQMTFLEPIWIPTNRPILDLIRWLRIKNRDRLDGFISAARNIFSDDYEIKYIDLATGHSPFNPTTFVQIDLKSNN